MTTPIRISLVTGFLGSGKTTLINELLPMPEMANSAVLVNELGQVSIDSDLIELREGDLFQLTNGCVCCALNEELGASLVEFASKRAAERRPLDRLIIETTGLANAGPIIEIILEDPVVRKLYELDKVITTVDALMGETNLNIHAESVEQVAVADRLLLTKLDLLSSAEQCESKDRLLVRLRQLNPSAPILTGDKADVIRDDLNDEERVGTRKRPTAPGGEPGFEQIPDESSASGSAARHDHHIKSFSITSDQPITLADLERFWLRLGEEAGPNLLRVKGLVNVAERPEAPAVVQGVQQVFDSLRWLEGWPGDDHRTRIVVIGWMLDQSRIEQMFEGTV